MKDYRGEEQQALNAMKELMPELLERITLNAYLTKTKYDALISEGFTAEQALEIVKSKGILE